MDQNRIPGYERTTWTLMNSSTDYLAEHVDMVNGKKEDWEYHTDLRTGKKLRSWDELYELWGHIRRTR